MCGYPMLLMRGRRLTHLDAGSCNSFMHDRFDNGCWPGRWARWEMEGTLTKWSYYSLSGIARGNYSAHCSSVSPRKVKNIPSPCVCPLPSSQQSWGWVGKEILGENKKPNCLADELRQLMIWLISPLTLDHPASPVMQVALPTHNDFILQFQWSFAAKKVASYRKPKSELNDCSRNVVTQMVFKRLGEVARIQGWAK